jgi:signal transduction histidine kinase
MPISSTTIAAFSLLILLAIGVVSFHNTIQDENERGWVSHTHVVIETLQPVLLDITRAETSQRAYLLTGDEKFLAQYESASQQLSLDVKDVAQLTHDNTTQQEAITHLQDTIAARQAALVNRIQLRKYKGLAASIDAVDRNNTGEVYMSEIRSTIGDMRSAENRLLTERQNAAIATARRLKIMIVGGNVLAVLLLAFAALALHRESKKRTLAERDLNRVNEHLRRRSIELADSNAELESFSYSVAHDLRAPLRQISGYCNALMQDYACELDVEASRFLQKIDEGAKKMGSLVDDLLSLSGIGRQELSLQTTSLNALVNDVVRDLASECSGREIRWQIDELPEIQCDPALVKQVLVNLISNAIKYTQKREHAFIRIGQDSHNGQRVIFMRDNGVGFDMQYAGKLFGVFQRLHKARDFEGTGVGLAIVYRIIRKHGGRVWAEAVVDQGATFYFTLDSSADSTKMRQTTATTREEEIVHVG